MINDLDETLKQLLIQEAGLDPAEVDISFDIPTRDWSTSAASRPTVNLYLFDIRENRLLREMGWDAEPSDQGRVQLKRLPVRVDLSYMITCWTSTTEDQHHLLWRVLETFFRHSPLPQTILQGGLRELVFPVRTEVAQPDGVLKNVSDFWGALENQLRPSINLVVTLELDLAQVSIAPLVFAGMLKVGQGAMRRDRQGHEVLSQQLEVGWEVAPALLGGVVRGTVGQPVAGASVRLIGAQLDDTPVQVGPTVQTDAAGRYVLPKVPPGAYTLVVEAAGLPPRQQRITVAAGERGQALPTLVHDVEVGMDKT